MRLDINEWTSLLQPEDYKVRGSVANSEPCEYPAFNWSPAPEN
jgi:hypothetical protein